MTNGISRKKIGLALGGGGAKGLAHIGVIKALEEANIPIDFISGTSMGALIGSWYALEKNIALIENFFLNIGKKGIVKSEDEVKGSLGTGLFRDQGIIDLMKKGFGQKSFSDCEIPFCAVATDVETGREVDLNSGLLADAVEASVAIPLVFKPVRLDGKLLMDGGVSNAVPADVVRRMGADCVISVDVSSKWVSFYDDLGKGADATTIIRDAFSALEYQISQKTAGAADVLLKPPVTDYHILDFSKAEDIIKAGAKETKYNLRAIRRKADCHKIPAKTLGEKISEFLKSAS